MDKIEFGTVGRAGGVGTQSEHFERYLKLDLEGEVDFSKNSRIMSFFLGKKKFTSFFQFSFNGKVCSMHNGDIVDLRPNVLKKARSNIFFISQLRKGQEELLHQLYEKYGYRIYPFILPVRKKYSISDHKYIPGKTKHRILGSDFIKNEKRFLSHMNFGLKHRGHRKSWIQFSRKKKGLFSYEFIGGA